MPEVPLRSPGNPTKTALLGAHLAALVPSLVFASGLVATASVALVEAQPPAHRPASASAPADGEEDSRRTVVAAYRWLVGFFGLHHVRGLPAVSVPRARSPRRAARAAEPSPLATEDPYEGGIAIRRERTEPSRIEDAAPYAVAATRSEPARTPAPFEAGPTATVARAVDTANPYAEAAGPALASSPNLPSPSTGSSRWSIEAGDPYL